ncbi:2OG-Fe(II) oxygenase family oxidoreductase [Xylariomycetidae sp. FL0641]|nr:2OG-Fe(II) oxygenase family oxidoreductase [Xylariomycetidae sp. FL0641]
MPAALLLLSSLQIWQWISTRMDVSSIVDLPFLKTSPLLPDNYECPADYNIELVSVDPLVMYINGFVKDAEVDHLLYKTEGKFEPSYVYEQKEDEENLSSVVNTTWRTSTSAMLPKSDVVYHCLSSRLQSLLGAYQHPMTERLQIVKYEGGERFRMHSDYLPVHMEEKLKDGSSRLYNRLVSVFAYLGDDCEGGETYFPDIPSVGPNADGDKFARTNTGMGLLVKPKKGNAVLWWNVHQNGTGDERLSHAGLPPMSGTKIGLNLFGIYYPDFPLLGAGF